MSKRKKQIAIIVLICLLVSPLFSCEFLGEHIHHHCTGKDCRVCAELEVASQNLMNQSMILVVVIFVSIILTGKVVFYLIRTNISLLHRTLISMNIELLE